MITRPRRRLGLTSWSDGAKVALVSALTVPFAVGWIIRITQVADDPTISTYVSRRFLPILVPFLWIQAAGHVLLVALGMLFRRGQRQTWLVHLEVQFWCACMVLTTYAVGIFTSPFGVMLLVLPVVGFLLFEPAPMYAGLVMLGLGASAAIILPLLDVLPYAPFLERAPYEHGRLQGAWVLSIGVPALFATVMGVIFHVHLVRQLRQRQEELERLTMHDPLTGLLNRGEFEKRLDLEVARARRYHLPLSVAMLDVDHFKAINDAYGHGAGDAVLRRVGERLRAALRSGDMAARHGGDELLVVLPHTDAIDGATVARRLAESLRADSDVTFTVSIGVAALLPDETADALVARADAALYEAKRGGRNRVSVAAAPEPASI